MALISRPYTYTSGTTISPTEVMAVEDTLFDEINGNLDETNLAATTQIPSDYLATVDPAKVDDLSGSASARGSDLVVSATGGTAASLQGELQQLRFKVRMLCGENLSQTSSLKTSYIDSSNASASANWEEGRIIGPNLLPNNGFECKTSATATDPPDGWTVLGTPTGLTIDTTASSEFGVNKRCLLVGTDANTEGIQYTVKGLKKSTKYLFGMVANLSSGTLAMSTTGALGAGNAYQNYSTTSTATGVTGPLQAIVKTDASATDIVVRFHSGAAGVSSFRIYYVWMYEISNSVQLGVPAIPMQTANYTTANDAIAGGGAATWTNRSALSLSQYAPCLGYRFVYEVAICFAGPAIAGTVRKYQYAFRIQQAINGGAASTVEGPYSWTANNQSNSEFIGGTVFLKYIIENPVPGSTYAFTTDVFVENDGADEAATMIINPTIGGGTAVPVSRARLIVERI